MTRITVLTMSLFYVEEERGHVLFTHTIFSRDPMGGT